MSKLKFLAIAAIGAVAGLLGFTQSASAAADADLLALGTTVSTTMGDNITGVLTAELPAILVIGLGVLIIFFMWRFVKKMIKG